MSDIITIPRQQEDYRFGQDSLQSPKALRANQLQILENVFPGLTGKPRNGINEKMRSTVQLGYDAVTARDTFFRPHALYHQAGGKEFFFIWHKNATNTTEFALEVWNLTDNTRTKLIYGDFGQSQVYFSMKPLYDAIYITMEYEMVTARENAYRTRNKILEYVSGNWTVREYGIDAAMSAAAISKSSLYCNTPAASNIANHATVVHNGKMWILGGCTVGYTASRKVLYSSDGFTWSEAGSNSLPYDVYYPACVSYNGKIWLIGGQTPAGAAISKIIYSSDGITWTEAGTDSMPVSSLLPTAWVYDNKMWIAYEYNGRIYRSIDGITWTQEGIGSLPAEISSGQFAQHNGFLWLFGWNYAGTAICFYKSSDGLTWSSESYPNTPNLVSAAFTEYDNALWVIEESKKVYKSINGLEWEEISTTTMPFSYQRQRALSFNDRLWIIGGVQDSAFQAEMHTSYWTTDGITWSNKESGIDANKYVSVAFTFVRLSATGNQTAYAEPISESVEDSDSRKIFKIKVTAPAAYGGINVSLPIFADAVAQGATHIRVWRTLGDASETVAAGLSHKYLCDIDITGLAPLTHADYTSDATLEGETHELNTTGYDLPPQGRYFDFDTRAWIGGCPDNPGYWFYSEIPANVEFPQKYAEMFKPADGYWIACDPDDGQKDTGTILFRGDRYFFKERKIFTLASSDPDNVPVLISDPIGCACPQTITRLNIPNLGGECIGFISELGPAVLLQGGHVRIMTEYSISELWPNKLGILRQSSGVPTDWYTRNMVTAAFWQRTWWLFFGDSRDSSNLVSTNKVAGFQFGNDGESAGAFQCVFAQYSGAVIYEPRILVPVDNVRAFTFSHKAISATINYRLSQFLDPSKWQDTFLDVGAQSYSMRAQNRFLFVSSKRIQTFIARRLIIYLQFADTYGLSGWIRSDDGRTIASFLYSQERQSGTSNTGMGAHRQYVAIDILDGLFGHGFDWSISKVVPDTGWVELFGSELEVEHMEREEEYSCAANIVQTQS